MSGEPAVITLLHAAKACLDSVDFATAFGEPVTVRHGRFRGPAVESLPDLAMHFVRTGTPENFATAINMHETMMQLDIDLVAEIELPPEDAGIDVTGCLRLSNLMALAIAAVTDPDRSLVPLAHQIVRGDIAPDDQSRPDQARMTCEISVLYRVRTDNHDVLLS
jgi:hypothetical protein